MDCFCFGSQSDDHPSLQEENPPPSTSRTTATSVAAVEVQNEDKIEIYVKSEEVEEVHTVPLKYLSYPTFRELIEKRSGKDSKKISAGQKIYISCKFELFERILKLVKYKEREAKSAEVSYDDRLWRRIQK